MNISYHNTPESAIKKVLKLERFEQESHDINRAMCGGDRDVMELISESDFYVVDRRTRKWFYVRHDYHEPGVAYLIETEEPRINIWDL